VSVVHIDHRGDRRGPGANFPPVPPFTVLLGPDYAGKSSALRALAGTCEVVSVDDEFLAEQHGVVRGLKRTLVKDVLPRLDDAYTVDFAVSVLQTAVVHLRDRLARCTGDRAVVVDSYYYKILAKCRLLAGDANPVFGWWRSFPRPERIVYLDVDPVTAWRRCGEGAATNRLEHYGTEPVFPAFAAFQRDLGEVMLEESRDVPRTVVPEQRSVVVTVAKIREAMVRRAA
jgi:thymidylate kinase